MDAAQRVSRGFHRLALFLAAIPLLIGGVLGVDASRSYADGEQSRHQQLLCAHDKVASEPEDVREGMSKMGSPDKLEIDLKSLGCSDYGNPARLDEVQNPPSFSWPAAFLAFWLRDLAISLAFAVAIYGIVYAIGWVIGGFAAS